MLIGRQENSVVVVVVGGCAFITVVIGRTTFGRFHRGLRGISFGFVFVFRGIQGIQQGGILVARLDQCLGLLFLGLSLLWWHSFRRPSRGAWALAGFLLLAVQETALWDLLLVLVATTHHAVLAAVHVNQGGGGHAEFAARIGSAQ